MSDEIPWHEWPHGVPYRQHDVSEVPGWWVAYARQRLRDASPTAAAIIDRGPQSTMREWSLMAVARRQLEEDRAARIAMETPSNAG